jgi:hypothetical protein
LAASSTMTLACCHEMLPASKAARVSGRVLVSSRDSDSNAPALRSLTVRTHATSATTAISWAVFSCGEAAGAARAAAFSAYAAARCTLTAAIIASARADSASPSRHSSA